MATSASVGSTTITATSGTVSGNATLTVTTAVIAVINLPRTGQTTCYDTAGNVIACAGTGQDGDNAKGVAWPNPRFTVGTGAEVDCVTDNLTGLMWVKTPDNTTRTWSNALSYANGLSLCGYTDWRLPNIIELESMVNAEQANSAIWLNTQGFSNIQASRYWSSTGETFQANYAYYVIMYDGSVENITKNWTYYVWPVRGTTMSNTQLWKTGLTTCSDAAGNSIACAGTGQDGEIQAGIAWPNPRFTAGTGAEADCVTDNLTGLMWAKTPGSTFITWADALTAANGLSLCGHTDWRLPNRKELRSLVDYSQTDPGAWLNTQGFSNVKAEWYWTSTSCVMDPHEAWFVYMWSNARTASSAKSSASSYFWPVRAGQ